MIGSAVNSEAAKGAGFFDRFERAGVGQIEALGVAAFRGEEVRALADGGIGDAGQHRLDLGDRALRDQFRGHVKVDDLVDERGVRAVFKQAADEIGEKIAVRTDGGVNAAAGAFGAVDDVMQTLAHTVQALEFEACTWASPCREWRRRCGRCW